MGRKLTTAQAAKRLGYSARRVRQLCEVGVIPSDRLTARGHFRLDSDELDIWLRKKRQSQPK